MVSGHIHMQTKFSNKLVNHTVETELIHINTETHHVYFIKSDNTLIKNKNKNKNKNKIMYTNKKNILLSILILYIYILLIFFFHLLPPWRVAQAQGLVGLTPRLTLHARQL